MDHSGNYSHVGLSDMLLMTTQSWLEKYFEERSRPSEITLLRWLRAGKIPGKKVGGSWYVDEHAWLADGDSLVEAVLRAG